MPDFNDKTYISDLRKYVKDNNLEKLFKEQRGKPSARASKKELLSFIKEQDIANNLSDIISDALKDNTLEGNTADDIKSQDLIEELQSNDFKPNDLKEEDEIEEIPIFKSNDLKSDNSKQEKKEDSPKYELNNNQMKVLKYINRFPEKLKIITSRPTFKQEFAALKDYNPEQTDEENLNNEKLLRELEYTLNGANIGAIITDHIFITVNAIETIIVAIRENKNGKIPSYIVDTIGQVRIEGLADMLQKNPHFHDCIDELLIKYDSYECIVKYLSVETRLLLIVLGSAFIVHKGNVKKEELKKESNTQQGAVKMEQVKTRFSGL